MKYLGNIFVKSIILVLITAQLCFSNEATDPNSRYAEILKDAVYKANSARPRGGWRDGFKIPMEPVAQYKFLVTGIMPVKGLDEEDAVPYLIDVMLNGPDWKDEKLLKLRGGMLPHIARCTAALSLGCLQDERAYEPLLKMLREGNFLEDKYNITYPHKESYSIKSAAAISLGLMGNPKAYEPLIEALNNEPNVVQGGVIEGLGNLRDPNAVDVLIDILKDEKQNMGFRRAAAEALYKIGDRRAIPAMLENAESLDLKYRIDDYLSLMTGKKFKTSYSREDKAVYADEYPELGKIDSYVPLWKHWLKKRKETVGNDFNKNYSELKEKKGTGTLSTADIQTFQESLSQYEVEALPFIISKIKEDNATELIPLVTDLTEGRVPEDSNSSEVSQWWDNNQYKWNAFYDSNN